MPPHPPSIAQRLLAWLIHDDLQEEVLGDLQEKFLRSANVKSVRRARLDYWYQVLNYLRPFALKKTRSLNSNYKDMLLNNFKIARRTMLKQKLYSTIKIGSFAIGIASCLLISMFIIDELSYDRHYANTDRIYRLIQEIDEPQDHEQWTSFHPGAKAVVEDEIPDVQLVARLIPYDWFDAGNNQVRREGSEKVSFEEKFAYADPELLQILEIPMIYGDQQSALTKPGTIVLNKTMADKYFPNQDPRGKTLVLNEDPDSKYSVGGVMQDFPKHSHLQFNFLITLAGEEFWPGEQTSWCCSNYNLYVLRNELSEPAEIEEKLLTIRDNYWLPYVEKNDPQFAETIAQYHQIKMQPISDIHLKSGEIFDILDNGDIRIVWLSGASALLILLLASMNFVNLSTAKSAMRSKEVGLRKVLGSHRGNLIWQFLTESVLFSLIAFVIAIILVILTLPFFNVLAGKDLAFPLQSLWLLPSVFLAVVVVGILAGLYPALYLSSFIPARVLQGKSATGTKRSSMRSVLVILQFSVSMLLIIAAIVVTRQTNFILNKEIGYDKEQILILHGTQTLGAKSGSFKTKLLSLPEVQKVTFSDFLPVSGTRRDQNGFWIDGRKEIDPSISAQKWTIDEDYFSSLGIELLKGRNFDPSRATDINAAIINQEMARKLAMEDPIGTKITNDFQDPFEVIGIVEDFHFESVRHGIGALVLTINDAGPSAIASGAMAAVKVNTKESLQAIAAIEGVWKDYLPNQTFRYGFLDQRFEAMYEDVERTKNVFSFFAGLAILIASAGLFALSGFMAEQRLKEITIRKVLGASFHSILVLLSMNFVKLIAISFVITAPLGWYLMTIWLDDYAYRIDFTWDVVLLTGFLGLAISFATTGYESIKASIQNPANGLRSE